MMERRNSSRRNSPVGLKRETFYRFKPLGVVVGDRRESVRSQTQVPKGNLFLESRSVHRSAHVFWLSACPALLRFASHRRREAKRSNAGQADRSEEHTSELQSQSNLVCRLLLEKKKKKTKTHDSDITYL